MNTQKSIKILYTNWKGETAIRHIVPIRLEYLANEWHPEEQWCLIAFDLDKQAERSFACKDIKNWFVD